MTPRRVNRWAAAAALSLMFALSASCVRHTVAQSGCPAAAPREAATLADLRARAQAAGTVRVIIQLSTLSNAGPALAQTQDAAMATLQAGGVEHAEALTPSLPYVVADVTSAQLDALYSDPHFAAWAEDRIAFPSLGESTTLVQAPLLWNLGGRGAGQSIAILDTGVEATHQFLSGRVAVQACFSTTSAASGSNTVCPNGQSSQTGDGAARPCMASGCEHGTHVAGIAAGRGGEFSGIAPDAEIIAVQVFSVFSGAACGGQPTCVASFTSDQIRGLDFVLQQAGHRAVAAVNMSLGGGRSTSFCDGDITKPVIDQLRAAGVATVIAAGNDGSHESVSFPGCISTAVTIAASTLQDTLASFSNCGPQVDLIAPGVGITSSITGGRFGALSGTSMATPHVTGAFAALRSLHPQATVDQIETALKTTGVDVDGRPRIRLLDAANALGGGATAEAAMSDGPQAQGAAELASLPPDQPVRLIVRVNAGADQVAAMARAQAAAQAAGVAHVERMGAQPMFVIEATPAQARALLRSGTVVSVQVDRTARTQH